MLEGVPFRGRECVLGMIYSTNLQTPPSHFQCATSSSLEEEFLLNDRNTYGCGTLSISKSSALA